MPDRKGPEQTGAAKLGPRTLSGYDAHHYFSSSPATMSCWISVVPS